MIYKRALIFLIIALSIKVSAEVVDRIMAIVGDEIILKSEVEQYVEHQRYTSKNDFNEKDFRKTVLDELVSNMVIYDVALKDSTIKVSDDEVQRILDSRINNIIEQVGSEEKFEKMYNTTVSDLKKLYRSDIRRSLFIDRLKNKYSQRVSVSRREVEDFYNVYKDSLPAVRSTVSLSQLVIKFSGELLQRSKSADILKELRSRILSGELTFESAAEQYSQDDATKIKGGNLGFTTRGDLVTDYERAAFNLEPGDISDPVKTSFGHHIIKLIEKSGEKINTSHILIKDSSTPDADSTALGFAVNIRDSILNKKMTFEEAVKKYSGDEKTKYTNGQIGILETDELDKKYSDIFKNAETGSITDPIKENDGYYIYKIIDKKSAHAVDIDQDYNTLKNIALDKKRRSEQKKWIDDLRKKVYIEVK
ncbi:MAG TPA: peptidylprolyl isomerase [Clostridiales bacterium]|nr:peptidylprolyl isomerase [Clostridiales bacterium]HQP69408.1 peptidylprolyl isomerase [Clostridiales bacterium]